jgi:hypothetical protein
MFTANALAALAILVAGTVSMAHAAQDASAVTAINVLVLPDKPTQTRAQQLNARLRQEQPRSFALDATHVPHIALLHEFVRTQDLPKVYGDVGRVLSRHPLVGHELTVKGLEPTPWNGTQMWNIAVEKSPDLAAAQEQLIEALRPYALDTGGADAFIATGDPKGINNETIEYVRTYREKQTGNGFKPHITIGLGDESSGDKLKAQLSASETFKVTSVAVYQLGNDGTARKELWRSSR